MKKIAFILSFFCTVAIYAQQEKEVRNNLIIGTSDEQGYLNIKNRLIVPETSIVFNLGYIIPVISNDLINKSFWDKGIGNGIEFSVDYRKQFYKKEIKDGHVFSTPKSLAAGAGLGFTYLNKSAKFQSFSEVLNNYTDVDGNLCNVNIDYRNVEESFSLTYVDIPLYVEFGKLEQTKTSLFLKLGLKSSFLISKKFTGEGNYTSTGYYPEWAVTLHDVPVLDYHTDKNSYENAEYKLSPFVLWGTVAGGINFPFSSLNKNQLSEWILRFGAKMDYSLTPVSKALPEAIFSGSEYRLNQSNILGGESRIFSVGFSLGLIYCF